MGDDYTVGELAREVQRALLRMEALAQQLQNGQFVSSEVFRIHKEGLDTRITALKEAIDKAATAETVSALRVEVDQKADKTEVAAVQVQVNSLAEDRKWLVRAILLIVIAAVLSVAFASGGLPGK